MSALPRVHRRHRPRRPQISARARREDERQHERPSPADQVEAFLSWLSLPGNMRDLCVSLLLCSLVLGLLPPTGAEEGGAAAGGGGGGGERRVRRSPPYWGMWSSDFYGWLEELRAQAAFDGMHDLARTFWAHFPISRELGYDSPDPDPEPEE